jgi:hypothetical protein
MERPWKTIQHAVDATTGSLWNPANICVAKGNYKETVDVPVYKHIYGGYNDSSNPWQRDIQSFITEVEYNDGIGYCFKMREGRSLIDGFQIIGGVYGSGYTNPTNAGTISNNMFIRGFAGYAELIENNIFLDGHIRGFGGTVRNNIVYGYTGTDLSPGISSGGGLIENNVVMNCQYGIVGGKVRNNIVYRCTWGGIKTGGTVEIVGNVISDTGWDAAIYGSSTLNGIIEGNIITRCFRGIVFSEGNPEIRNNVITGCGYGIISSSGWPTIRNCIFWDNMDDLVYEPWDIKYCLTGEGYPGEGNISVDPKFVGWGEFTLENPLYVDVNYTGEEEDGTAAHPYKTIRKGLAAYDFHLSEDSPCIGAGEGGLDMGAYPGVAPYSPVHSPTARIDVLPGTYYEWNLHPGNRVWLRAVNGPGATLVKEPGLGGLFSKRVFQATDRAIIDGFRIMGANYGIQSHYGKSEEGLRPVVINCILEKLMDAAVYEFRGSVQVISCLAYDNDDGIFLDDPDDVVNSVVYGNDLGISVAHTPDRLFRLRNSIFWGNVRDDAVDESYGYMKYCDTGSGATDPTNFSENPQFVGPGSGDFHLRLYSPCRNRGTEELAPVFDPEGRLRGQGKVVDVGLYEYEEGWEWSFPGGATEDWVSAGAPMTFSEPEFPWSDGGLLMRATSNTDCFGYWGNEMKEIAYVEDSVYELRWETKRTVSGSNRYPVMRLRTNTDNLEESTMIVINDSGELTSGTETGVYTLYLVRPEQFLEHPGQGYRKLADQEKLLLSFDMLNFDPAGDPVAEMMLDKIEVFHSRYRKDWQAQELMNCDFDDGTKGWTYSGEIWPFTAPLDSSSSECLTLQSTTNTDCFGFWESQVIELPTTATQTLLRATFTVKSDQEAGDNPLPIARLRIIREDSSEVAVKTIEGNGSRAPGVEPRDYTVCYWLVPQTEPYRLRLAFDLVNFNPEASATATLLLYNVKLTLLSRR